MDSIKNVLDNFMKIHPLPTLISSVGQGVTIVLAIQASDSKAEAEGYQVDEIR